MRVEMVLEQILKNKQREVKVRKDKLPLTKLKGSLSSQLETRSFYKAIARPNLSIIAEVKKASPTAGIINKTCSVEKLAQLYEQGGAAAISVLTDEKFFAGSLKDLEAVKEKVSLPVLRKDFIIDEYQLYESKLFGADAVLLIASVLSFSKLNKFLQIAEELGLDVLVEVHDYEDLAKALESEAKLIGINNRNLTTMRVDIKTTLKLLPLIPFDKIVVSESGINSLSQIRMLLAEGIDGVLIGEMLARSQNPDFLLRKLQKV
jgi:indole-3-glycerol phosphate synthase